MVLSYADSNVDLVVNRLTRSIYNSLKAAGQIDDKQLYVITDDPTPVELSNALSGYYTKTETNALSTTFRDGLAATSSLTAYETKSDLTANYYTKTQTNALSTTFREGLAAASSLTAYQPSGDYRTGTQISAIASAYATSVDNKLSGYYAKSETSSATQIDAALSNKTKVIIYNWED